VVAKLHDDFVAALREPAVQARLTALGAVAVGGTPEALAAKIRAEGEKWGPVIRAAGIQLD
jgi:tripartite-type tricarboxylate transporter receptor subunit TctC